MGRGSRSSGEMMVAVAGRSAQTASIARLEPPVSGSACLSEAYSAVISSDPVACSHSGLGCSSRHRSEAHGHVALPAGAPRVVGITGVPRSGKDALAHGVASHYSRVARIAFSDPIIEDVNRHLAWAGRSICELTKSAPHNRLLIQEWGAYRRAQNPDHWIDAARAAIQRELDAGAQLVVVTGVRMPKEVDMIKTLGDLWRVIRPVGPAFADHPIERSLDDLPADTYDAVLMNDREGDLGPLVQSGITALTRTRR